MRKQYPETIYRSSEERAVHSDQGTRGHLQRFWSIAISARLGRDGTYRMTLCLRQVSFLAPLANYCGIWARIWQSQDRQAWMPFRSFRVEFHDPLLVNDLFDADLPGTRCCPAWCRCAIWFPLVLRLRYETPARNCTRDIPSQPQLRELWDCGCP